MISPPTLASRAFASDITPFGVERIATPRPLATVGMSLHGEYTRRPGLEMRSISRMAGWPLWYFSSISNCGMFALQLDARVTADVAFVLQARRERGRAGSEAGVGNFRAATHLRIADAGQHIAQRIVNCHCALSLPARLDHARDAALAREFAQLVAAHPSLR